MSVKVGRKNNSPFRYPGGKFYARKLILECIPEHHKYCEPFAGGGSVFFAKEKVEQNVLNDKDEELVNTYYQIQNNLDGLLDLLKDIKATKELHRFYKKEYVPKNDLERAFRWFYLNRTSYSGIMKQSNCYWGYGEKYSMRPENWPNHLRTVNEKLQDIRLKSLDFEELIDNLEDDYFLFVDPPYFNARQEGFYEVSFKLEDHYRLEKVLRRNSHRLKFLITYDNCEEIRELYSWCHEITDKEWNYTISRTDDQKNNKKLAEGHSGKRFKGQEVFITNYSLDEVRGVKEHKYDNSDLFSTTTQ